MAKFSDTISKWTQRMNVAMEAVAKESAQELAEEVSKPIAKGGRIPVDTGFLRNSMAAALNSIPSGESSDSFDMQPVTLVINKLKAGDRLVLGFTANYARVMEYRYFFVRSAAQNWPLHVDKSIKKVSRAIK
mgnify:CR=1 FL=1